MSRADGDLDLSLPGECDEGVVTWGNHWKVTEELALPCGPAFNDVSDCLNRFGGLLQTSHEMQRSPAPLSIGIDHNGSFTLVNGTSDKWLMREGLVWCKQHGKARIFWKRLRMPLKQGEDGTQASKYRIEDRCPHSFDHIHGTEYPEEYSCYQEQKQDPHRMLALVVWELLKKRHFMFSLNAYLALLIFFVLLL
jgi:hypothetical protein